MPTMTAVKSQAIVPEHACTVASVELPGCTVQLKRKQKKLRSSRKQVIGWINVACLLNQPIRPLLSSTQQCKESGWNRRTSTKCTGCYFEGEEEPFVLACSDGVIDQSTQHQPQERHRRKRPGKRTLGSPRAPTAARSQIDASTELAASNHQHVELFCPTCVPHGTVKVLSHMCPTLPESVEVETFAPRQSETQAG